MAADAAGKMDYAAGKDLKSSGADPVRGMRMRWVRAMRG